MTHGSGEYGAPALPRLLRAPLLVLLLASMGCEAPAAGFSDEFLRGADLDQEAAAARVNECRRAAGLRLAEVDPAIHLAAGRHAAYLLENRRRLRQTSSSPHVELPWWPGFVAEEPLQRVVLAGFAAGLVGGEVVHWEADGVAAVDSWIGSVYHRVAALAPETSHLGHASLAQRSAAVDVMNFGYQPEQDAERVSLWPPPDATDVPAAFDGRENPQPPAPPEGWPSGSPVSLIVERGRAEGLRHRSSSIVVDGAPWPHLVLDPTNDAHLTTAIFLYTEQPFPAGATVEVALEWTDAQGPARRAWSFRVAQAPPVPGEPA